MPEGNTDVRMLAIIQLKLLKIKDKSQQKKPM
jgi:hypothetical protein